MIFTGAARVGFNGSPTPSCEAARALCMFAEGLALEQAPARAYANASARAIDIHTAVWGQSVELGGTDVSSFNFLFREPDSDPPGW